MALLKESTSNSQIEKLVPGFEFAPASYKLDASLVSKYIRAVGGEGGCLPDYVPPLAIAAYALNALAKSLTLPPGSIHAAQEFEFFKLVPVGTTISCQGRVVQKLSRGKLNMLVIGLEALAQNGERVLSGKATLILPN